jgi:choline dehydrogenase-like flavoprotein
LIAGIAAGAAALGPLALHVRRRLREPKLDYDIPEFHGRQARLSEVLDAPPFDVCVVGSGPAGTVLGTQLARAGVRTLIVEAGVNPSQVAKDARYAKINQATQSGDRNYAVAAARAMMPGGTSGIWTGNTPRLLPIDFEKNAYTPQGTQWPVTYAQLDPYYEMAEETLHVSGESNVRYVPPRSHPLRDERRGGNRELKSMLARADVVAFDTFRSRSPTGGPIRVARDLLPAFANLPDAAFLPGFSVRRLIGGAHDRVDGVLLGDMDGNEFPIRARVCVIAAGAVESARLLLLSRSEQYPQGAGNAHDQVGRSFADHLYCNFTSTVARRHVFLGGPLPQAVRSFQFYEVFKRNQLGSLGLTASLRPTASPDLELRLTAGCELEPSASNRVSLDPSVVDVWGDPVAHVHFGASERDWRTQHEACALVTRLLRKMHGHHIEELASHWGHHHLGTVRMGNDVRTSVVDANLKLHGLRNAHVLSSGNFVTSGPANPTLLIVAFAHRLAEHLVSRMREGAYAAPLERVRA